MQPGKAANQNQLPPLVQRAAQFVVSSGLAAPALALLELHRPLWGLAESAGLVLEPSLRLFMGASQTRGLTEFLSDPSKLDGLIKEIERLSRELCPQGKPSTAGGK